MTRASFNQPNNHMHKTIKPFNQNFQMNLWATSRSTPSPTIRVNACPSRVQWPGDVSWPHEPASESSGHVPLTPCPTRPPRLPGSDALKKSISTPSLHSLIGFVTENTRCVNAKKNIITSIDISTILDFRYYEPWSHM